MPPRDRQICHNLNISQLFYRESQDRETHFVLTETTINAPRGVMQVNFGSNMRLLLGSDVRRVLLLGNYRTGQVRRDVFLLSVDFMCYLV